MPVTSNDIFNATPSSMLSYYETRIKETKQMLFELKRKATFLKRKIKNNDTVEINDFNMRLTNIKWSSEIRSCIMPDNSKKKFYIATTSQITSWIAYRNSLELINRDIRAKISCTLSLMFRKGEIGRLAGESGRNHLYGIKEFFEEDLVTLKSKYHKHFNKFMEETIVS